MKYSNIVESEIPCAVVEYDHLGDKFKIDWTYKYDCYGPDVRILPIVDVLCKLDYIRVIDTISGGRGALTVKLKKRINGIDEYADCIYSVVQEVSCNSGDCWSPYIEM